MRKLFPAFTVAGLLFVPLFFNTGCQPFKKEASSASLDSLDHMLQLTDNSLIVNLTTIKQRKDSLYDRLDLIHKYSKDSLDDQHKAALIKLAGIGTEYTKILNEQPVLEYDFEKLKKDVVELHHQIDQGKIKSEDIPKTCNQYSNRLGVILKNATEINKIAHSVENDYRRVGIIINPWYGHLKKNATKGNLVPPAK